ncbi:hypothetical protein [Streptomyces sp. NL15-2K]|uniref:hypothetical protein n=1 Tax=Streptomyces sp. NL15-2K TaxID=376149 RepID=UPI000FF96513|nr:MULTISPECIES: hypothetical protein [Actinomycetes]WKX07089.1 hypothetical protein Q4V64_06170 [Kutzneria buriramensis]GCB53430.1 hypothetical protein SNL152K_10787 [Streptomyces sp. NL15-2K]
MPRGDSLTPAGRYLQAAGRRLIAEEQRLSATMRACLWARRDGIVTPVTERFAGLFGADETGEWAG